MGHNISSIQKHRDRENSARSFRCRSENMLAADNQPADTVSCPRPENAGLYPQTKISPTRGETDLQAGTYSTHPTRFVLNHIASALSLPRSPIFLDAADEGLR